MATPITAGMIPSREWPEGVIIAEVLSTAVAIDHSDPILNIIKIALVQYSERRPLERNALLVPSAIAPEASWEYCSCTDGPRSPTRGRPGAALYQHQRRIPPLLCSRLPLPGSTQPALHCQTPFEEMNRQVPCSRFQVQSRAHPALESRARLHCCTVPVPAVKPGSLGAFEFRAPPVRWEGPEIRTTVVHMR